MALFFGWIIGAFIVGIIGANRKIGFGGALFISLLLSPLIGIIITATSKTDEDVKMEQEALKIQKEQLDALANQKPSTSIADELKKLADLKESGVITEEEFEAQKQKILSA